MTKVRLAFLLTLALWVVGSLLPEIRMWGVGFLHQTPGWVWLVSLSLPVLVFVALEFWPGTKLNSPSSPKFAVVGFATGIVALGLFLVLKQNTHFLGDGTLQLSTLAMAEPVVGGRDAGSVHTLLAIKYLLGTGVTAALTAYQIAAIGSGLLLIVAAFVLAARVFDDRSKAALFALGQLSGGYMLVYFGYVGNFALFILSVSLFALLGIGACTRKTNRWWTVLPFAAAVWFHALGWTLLPVLVYVLLTHTPWSHRLRDMSVGSKALWVMLISIGGGALFYWKYTTDLFFRFAFLPPLADRFTVDGYTLLSPKHFIDLGNLFLLLIPGLLVGLAYTWKHPGASTKRNPARTFLWLFLWCTVLAVFVVDPKFGMPGNWDLLAFCGIPTLMLLYYLILTTESPHAGKVALVCIALGWAALFPRAYVQATPLPGARLAQSYFAMDPQRSRTGVQAVGQYLLDHNYTAEYGRLADFRKRTYPEEALRDRLNFLFRDGKMSEALLVCQNITRMNPRMYSAWMFLGFINNNAGRHDSASFYLEVADGLNPYTPGILNELGRAYYFSNRQADALELWERSLALDSSQYVPVLAIARWHKSQGDDQEASRLLAVAASKPGAPGNVHLELARDHAENSRLTDARVALMQAIENQADTLKVQAFVREYPMLAPPPADTTKAGAPEPDAVSDAT